MRVKGWSRPLQSPARVTERAPIIAVAGASAVSPSGKEGPTVIFGESSNYPLAFGLIDLTRTDEQVILTRPQGTYLIESVMLHSLDGDLSGGAPSVTVTTMDAAQAAARGGGETLIDAQPLTALIARNAAPIIQDVTDSPIRRVPYFYASVTNPLARGSVIFAAYGKVIAAAHPGAATYDPRLPV